ncbi:MAG TPA: GGDEF domain-containing protein [Acidothermaceae bacterium]|jgi:diguanylate cyclase (GGDEF)-like protein|nr:GGDEF domain-containing protein [Acidothermaceae bacterium]
MSLPRAARAFVVTVSALYAAAVVVGVLTTRVTASGLTIFVVLVACALVSIEGSLRLVWSGPKAGRSTNDLLAVWTIPVVLLLPPLYGALVVVPIFAFLQLRVGKRPPVKLLFSISAAGLANFVAASLHRGLVADPTRWDVHSLVGTPGALAAIVVCIAVRHVINMGLVAEVMALTSANSSTSRLRDHLVDSDAWVGIAAESCTGVLVALACAASPYAVLFALAPVLVLQRTLLLAEFRDAARTDPKTGLANSSYWRDVAEREIKRARSGGEPLAVLMVDIDNFKSVNDKYGHLTGDDVLRSVATGLTDGLRPRDFVGRFGGEEFVILLAGSDLDQARQTAERVRAQVAEVSVADASDRERVSVTVSVGVAAFRDSGHSVHELLDAADAALYAAKHAGRNCVRVAEGARQQVLDLTPHGHRLIDLRQREPVD